MRTVGGAQQRHDVYGVDPALVEPIAGNIGGRFSGANVIELLLECDGADGGTHSSGGSAGHDFEYNVVRGNGPPGEVVAAEGSLTRLCGVPLIERFDKEIDNARSVSAGGNGSCHVERDVKGHTRIIMPMHVALLRGINVGTAKRVAMADLKALFEDLGYRNVKTLLNSGNVVFSGNKPSEEKIEAAFTKRFGFSSRITLVSAEELAAIVQENPIAEIPDTSRFLVSFLKTAAHREQVAALEKREWHPEALALGKRVAYMWCPEGVLASALAAAVNKLSKDGVTARNWATVLKIKNAAG
jgi:uncharacterized protein (DUF1697 family)